MKCFLIAVLSSILLVGCSDTPSPQSLEQSVTTSTAKVGAASEPSAPPAQLTAAASLPRDLQNFGSNPDLESNPNLEGNPSQDFAPTQIPGHRYILGPGDVVTVTVWGHPELSGKRVIGPDGEIQLPFVGSFRVAGLSADDASGKLTSALREDYLNTAASVTIDSYNSNQIIVLGHVAHQGVLTFAGNPTLLEALAMAGAATGKDDTGAMPVRCAVIRGRDRIMWIDLRPLLKGKDISLNIPLQRNDLVYVPDPDEELVYVMGQVKNPGPYPLTANMSFLEALARAGGPSDNAQQGKIVLARKNTEQVIDLEGFVQKGSNTQLEAGDIVYVPKNGVAKVGYVLQQLNPLTTLAFIGALL